MIERHQPLIATFALGLLLALACDSGVEEDKRTSYYTTCVDKSCDADTDTDTDTDADTSAERDSAEIRHSGMAETGGTGDSGAP